MRLLGPTGGGVVPMHRDDAAPLKSLEEHPEASFGARCPGVAKRATFPAPHFLNILNLHSIY
ncbi:MAG: hypothetical protein R2825_08025 [Saprospiraceae bacterium]